MSLASDMALLRRVPFFELFADEQLRLLAFGSENQRFQPNDVLFRIGDATDGGLVILSGEIVLSDDRNNSQGERLRAGTLLGQRALLAPTTRRHNAVALSNVEVLLIRRAVFVRMLAEFPDLAAQIYADMSSELHALTEQASAVIGGHGQH